MKSSIVAFIVALYIAYKLYVWKRLSWLIAKSGLPVVRSETAHLPWVHFWKFLENWKRAYDWKLESYEELKQELGVKPGDPPIHTVIIPSPFWNPEPLVSTVDPIIVRHFLKDKFDSYVKPSYTMLCLRELLGQGLFGVNHGPSSPDGGAHWTIQRKTASKVFTNNNFNQSMFRAFAKHARIVGDLLNAQCKAHQGTAIVEMQAMMFAFTLDSIGEVGFGMELDTLTKGSAFSEAFDRAQHLCTQRFLSPFWDSWFGKLLYAGERELPTHLKVMDEFMYDIIRKKKANKRPEDGDILSLFIEEKLGMSDVELRDVVFSFLIAGRDTTACTLSFALMLLAMYPEWQRNLMEEIHTFRKTSPNSGDVLNSKELSQLKQLNYVVMECLRLYPPVPSDVKQATEDDILPGGYPIPKGTRIMFEPFMASRIPEFWGEDCMEFRPQRWAERDTLPTPYEFPVFQAGPRICLGESMAKFEAQLMLAYLVENYEFALPPGTDKANLTYAPGITLKVKDGLPLCVTRRLK